MTAAVTTVLAVSSSLSTRREREILIKAEATIECGFSLGKQAPPFHAADAAAFRATRSQRRVTFLSGRARLVLSPPPPLSRPPHAVLQRRHANAVACLYRFSPYLAPPHAHCKNARARACTWRDVACGGVVPRIVGVALIAIESRQPLNTHASFCCFSAAGAKAVARRRRR